MGNCSTKTIQADLKITMEKSKTKAIQADFDIFTYIS